MKELAGYEMNDNPQTGVTYIDLRVLDGNTEDIFSSMISTHIFSIMSKDEVLEMLMDFV